MTQVRAGVVLISVVASMLGSLTVSAQSNGMPDYPVAVSIVEDQESAAPKANAPNTSQSAPRGFRELLTCRPNFIRAPPAGYQTAIDCDWTQIRVEHKHSSDNPERQVARMSAQEKKDYADAIEKAFKQRKLCSSKELSEARKYVAAMDASDRQPLMAALEALCTATSVDAYRSALSEFSEASEASAAQSCSIYATTTALEFNGKPDGKTLVATGEGLCAKSEVVLYKDSKSGKWVLEMTKTKTDASQACDALSVGMTRFARWTEGHSAPQLLNCKYVL